MNFRSQRHFERLSGSATTKKESDPSGYKLNAREELQLFSADNDSHRVPMKMINPNVSRVKMTFYR
jgi:hypothetical protein